MSERQCRDSGNFMIFGGVLILIAAITNVVFAFLGHESGVPISCAEVCCIIRSVIGIALFGMFTYAGIKLR